MHSATTRPSLARLPAAVIAGAVVIAALMLDLLELPVEAPPLLGITVLVLAGAGIAWAGGGLAAVLIGGAGAIGLAVLLSAFMHRAFGQTPWRMHAIDFLPRLSLTVAIVAASLAVGWLALSMVRRRAPIVPRWRDLLGAAVVAFGVIAGGTVFAELVQAVIPANAQEVRISIEDGALRVQPATFSAGAPTYLLVESEAELLYLPVTSDADAERRRNGDLVDREGLAGFIAPRDLANNLRRSGFAPGRYILVAVEPQEPVDESTVLIVDPNDPPPDTRTMRTDIAPAEFVVTD
jgi:hypothetical protein